MEVDILLKNNSESCVKIKTLCEFENGIAFTDFGDRKVKLFCLAEKTVKTLLGSGKPLVMISTPNLKKKVISEAIFELVIQFTFYVPF